MRLSTRAAVRGGGRQTEVRDHGLWRRDKLRGAGSQDAAQRAPGRGGAADLGQGLRGVGFKDTFPIFPGERVRLLVAPTEPGLFMYHCHILEHEDGGMMRNCWFGPGPVSSA